MFWPLLCILGLKMFKHQPLKAFKWDLTVSSLGWYVDNIYCYAGLYLCALTNSSQTYLPFLPTAWWEWFLTFWRLLVLPDCHLFLCEWRNALQQHLLRWYFYIDIGRCFITGQKSVFNLMEDLIECFLDYWVRSSGMCA